jgi:flagellar motor switch protein FliN
MSSPQGGHALAAQWTAEFASVMEAMADQRPEMAVMEEAAGTGSGELWWKQPLDAVPDAVVWVGAQAAAWTLAAQHILAAAGIDEADETESRGTWLEVVKQSLGGLASRIAEQIGREVSATGGAEEAPPPEAPRFLVSMKLGEHDLPALDFRVSAALAAALSGTSETAPAIPAEIAMSADVDGAEEPTSMMSGRACRTLDVLLDVDMPVSVSFGRTQVKVQDVLKLITGSIVELERAIAEPVEVIVNNCVIARGEVVVVDGNYGVRIGEIMSKRERLQQSRKYLLPVQHNRKMA